MKNQLIIIGAGAMGRETCNFALEMNMEVKGFLDSRSNILEKFSNYPNILSNVESYALSENDLFICAIGDPSMKMKYAELIASRGGIFHPLIHPSAYIGHNVKVGPGSIIAPNVSITSNVLIEDHVIVNVNSSISHDCVIETGTTISPGCTITGNCRLGRGVFMGAHSALIPNITVGRHAFIAAGAVVTSCVEENSRVMGVPAKRK